MNPFDYVTAITYTKKNMIVDDETESAYQPYMVNRSLSYFQDTVAVANAMNSQYMLDNKLQFDFLINIVRKRKRFSKWLKPEIVDDLEVVKEYSLLRTDYNGWIEVATDGFKMWVEVEKQAQEPDGSNTEIQP